MRYLPAVYCADCNTTILYGTDAFVGCNCSVSMEYVLGMPEAERLEQDYSSGPMLPTPEIPDLITLPELSEDVIAECRAEMAQGQRRGWRN